jgi:hypothetical protein
MITHAMRNFYPWICYLKESAIDALSFGELRSLTRQAPQELGQWDAKGETAWCSVVAGSSTP